MRKVNFRQSPNHCSKMVQTDWTCLPYLPPNILYHEPISEPGKIPGDVRFLVLRLDNIMQLPWRRLDVWPLHGRKNWPMERNNENKFHVLYLHIEGFVSTTMSLSQSDDALVNKSLCLRENFYHVCLCKERRQWLPLGRPQGTWKVILVIFEAVEARKTLQNM